jgi:UPF0755 protein
MRRRRALRLVARTALLLAAVAALGALWVYWSLARPVGKGEPQTIAVHPGQSARAVAGELQRKGLIRSRRAFLAAARWSRKGNRLKAGGYRFSPTMSALEILDALVRGTHQTWRWLTIPEGFTMRQMGERVEEKGLGTADAFRRAAAADTFAPGFPLPRAGLEGYLFPDTYRAELGADPSGLLAQMLRRFREVVWQGMFAEKASYHGRSLNDIVTLASCVEAEAKRGDERAVIAGVLANRLAQGMRLECDATVQYALGAERKARLFNKDLLVESEYNTYLHPGLPPGPICSPGVASIRAAMNPARVPYLYYVAQPDGSHVFSRTFAEHEAAIARIRREQQAGSRAS